MSDCKVKSSCTNLNGSTGEEGSFPRKSHIVCPTPPRMRLRRFCIHMITFILLYIHPSNMHEIKLTYLIDKQNISSYLRDIHSSL